MASLEHLWEGQDRRHGALVPPPMHMIQNFGCQSSIAFFNVVSNSLSEPQSKDVQPDERSGTSVFFFFSPSFHIPNNK